MSNRADQKRTRVERNELLVLWYVTTNRAWAKDGLVKLEGQVFYKTDSMSQAPRLTCKVFLPVADTNMEGLIAAADEALLTDLAELNRDEPFTDTSTIDAELIAWRARMGMAPFVLVTAQP